MKVRQSLSVTAELGDPNSLASFDGRKSLSIGLCVFHTSEVSRSTLQPST
jgi:hypothetical protein